TAVARWRSERWLHVENPALLPMSADAEREALALAPKLAGTLRMLRARVGDVTATWPDAPDVNPSRLSKGAARRLAEIADSMNMPPVAPIVIATRTYGPELRETPGPIDAQRSAREALAAAASEEKFVAAYAQLSRLSPHDAAPSLAAVWAAVALRPLG